jgi:hypothetical protein
MDVLVLENVVVDKRSMEGPIDETAREKHLAQFQLD